MKKTFKLESGVFGEGQQKICVPIVEKEQDAIWKKAEEIADLDVDVVEWRADFYDNVFSAGCVKETLKGLKARLPGKSILFTFRTRGEGGELAIAEEDYYELNCKVAESKDAALIDLEVFLNEDRSAKMVKTLQAKGVHVIASNHDFEKTPDVEEMVRRLKRMEALGADVAKLAVMPKNSQDVLNLLQATLHADQLLDIPVVTMSMGKMGAISRVSGSCTGCAMTFAAVGTASAPGQIPVDSMRNILEIL